MVTELTAKLYLQKLPNTGGFFALDSDEQNRHIFAALELLKDNFPIERITDRAVALQVLYALEGEEDEFSKLKRHGVKTYTVKGVSITFEGTGISPDVLDLLEDEREKVRAMVGRLI